jgi:hypothetical protein
LRDELLQKGLIASGGSTHSAINSRTRNANAGGLAMRADFRDLIVAELPLDAAGWLT